jgi:hypothetical protein
LATGHQSYDARRITKLIEIKERVFKCIRIQMKEKKKKAFISTFFSLIEDYSLSVPLDSPYVRASQKFTFPYTHLHPVKPFLHSTDKTLLFLP